MSHGRSRRNIDNWRMSYSWIWLTKSLSLVTRMRRTHWKRQCKCCVRSLRRRWVWFGGSHHIVVCLGKEETDRLAKSGSRKPYQHFASYSEVTTVIQYQYKKLSPDRHNPPSSTIRCRNLDRLDLLYISDCTGANRHPGSWAHPASLSPLLSPDPVLVAVSYAGRQTLGCKVLTSLRLHNLSGQ